jgi:hypothetical protein
MKNYHNLVYNFICESNNAKIIYVTNQVNHCDASNILNSKNKVRNTNNIYIFFYKNNILYRVFGSLIQVFHKK